MEEEVWVAGRGEEIRAWVATNNDCLELIYILYVCLYRGLLTVASGVHAHVVIREGWVTTLHVTPEGLDISAVE